MTANDQHLEQTLLPSDPTYPDVLRRDLNPPAQLFVRGDPSLLGAHPSVGIIGTRRCTHYGREIARRLGRELSENGVHVVSGLALGIDGAAHEGALLAEAAGPVAVVGSGLDVVYPRAHFQLWKEVAQRGVLISEAPPGSTAEPWRFPLRNRLIAALSDVLVVVESRRAGGSMHTVEAAAQRSVSVMAVPGPITSVSSEGTNQLLIEGCAPACSTDDILAAISLERRDLQTSEDPSQHGSFPACSLLSGDENLLCCIDWVATPVDVIARRSERDLEELIPALYRLASVGAVAETAQGWERSAAFKLTDA